MMPKGITFQEGSSRLTNGALMKTWGNKVTKIITVDTDGYCLTLRFEDGATGTVCLSDIFDKPKGLSADILKGGMFEHCFVESGAVAWPNGFELCPDALRLRFEEQRNQVRKAA